MTDTTIHADFELPSYPALHRCILIDSRHGSRVEISRDLKTTMLFDKVWEASSIKDGMSVLELEDMDACFLGASVSVESVEKFLKYAKEKARSKDCALITVLNRIDERLDEKKERMLAAGAHGFVLRPCTKMNLSDWVVRAVVKANANGAWAAIFKNSGHEDAEVPDPFRSMRPAAAESSVPAPPLIPEVDGPLADAMLSFVQAAVSSNDSLKALSAGVESGEFPLDPSGELAPRTKDAVNRALNNMIPFAGKVDPAVQHFRDFCETALSAWMKDLIATDMNQATERLRRALLAYKPESLSD